MQTQNRFKSWPLWTAIFALIVFCSKMYFHYEIPGADQLINLILPVVVGFGIINNPTDPNKL
jgi:uncharacterized membrane protein